MRRIFISDLFFISVLVTCIPVSNASCGCKHIRQCYKKMIENLQTSGEESCIENSSIGTATLNWAGTSGELHLAHIITAYSDSYAAAYRAVCEYAVSRWWGVGILRRLRLLENATVFLQALQTYCGHIIRVNNTEATFEGKPLFEVVINGSTWGNSSRTVIILDAGQDGAESTVGFALYVIEQLVSCIENADLIQDVRWVIMPSTNPDGLEFNRNALDKWKKNVRVSEAYGVDITRNFDESWSNCPNKNPYSPNYPGEQPASENETRFIADVLDRYKPDAKVYVSFRRDGHALLYPYAAVNSTSDSVVQAKSFAAEIAAKVNQKITLQWFLNDSIYNMNLQPHCGHSVDYAFNKLFIPYCFEMRIFLDANNEIISQLQTMPKGYEASLRTSYFNGIKEMFKLVTKNKNYVT